MHIMLVMCPCYSVDAPPLGLAYLSSYLKQEGFQVSARDLNVEYFHQATKKEKEYWELGEFKKWYERSSFSFIRPFININRKLLEQWAREICSAHPEVIGFSVFLTNIYIALQLSRMIKRINPGIKIILGGPSAYFPSDIKRFMTRKIIDALIMGEGEKPLARCLKTLQATGQIQPGPGIVVPGDNKSAGEFNSDLIENLDALPFPDFAVFPLNKYRLKGAHLPIAPSRGCVGRCAFCFERVFWDNRYRHRSAKNVFDEIKRDVDQFNCSRFIFAESLVNGNPRMLEELCDLIIGNRLKIEWWGMALISNKMTNAFLKKVRQAGCTDLSYGVESASQKVLNLMNKKINVPLCEKVIRATHNAGIKTSVLLIAGFPGEEEEDFQKTIDFVVRNGKFLNEVNVSHCGLAPSSTLDKHKNKYGVIGGKWGFDWYMPNSTNNMALRKRRVKDLKIIVLKSIKTIH